MRKLLLLTFGLFLFNLSHGQNEMADFQTTARAGVGTTFAEEYNALGINAANLAREPFFFEKKTTIGLLAFNLTMFTAPLSKSEALGIFGENQNLTYQQKLDYSSVFINEPISINLDYLIFGAYYQHRKAGGFAFVVRDKVQWYSAFDTKSAELMFLGFNSQYFDQVEIERPDGSTQIISNSPNMPDSLRSLITKGILSDTTQAVNYSTIVGNTNMSMVAFREYSLGWGREVYNNGNFKVEGGVGLRYIAGYNMTEIRNRDGKFEAYGAFSPWLEIDFGSAAATNPTAISNKRFGLGGFNVVGNGFGFDLGLSLEYKKRTNFGIALNNVGFITWDKNLYQAIDKDLVDLDNGGFESLNFFEEAQKFGGDDGLFEWETGIKRTINLPANLRIGVSQELRNTLHVGVDLIMPVNDLPGAIESPIISVGGDFTPMKIIRASTGFTYGGNFDSRVLVPVGCSVMLGEGSYEFGLATRDIVTFFRQKGPVISAGFGFFKFRF